jgi:hypothetical protein
MLSGLLRYGMARSFQENRHPDANKKIHRAQKSRAGDLTVTNIVCQWVVPHHKKPDRGTLRAILRQADLSPHESERLL